jgi:hypothetical protein
VHLGQETQAFLFQDLWNKVTKLLNLTLQIEDIELRLDQDFNLDWSGGKGVIKCIKENTLDIFIKMIQDFKIKGQKFRAYVKSHTVQGQGIQAPLSQKISKSMLDRISKFELLK